MKLNYTLIILVAITGILFSSFYFHNYIISPSIIILLGILTFLSIKVSWCYCHKMNFSISYVMLAIFFATWLIGEVIYFAQGFYGEQTFPNWEDIPLTIMYVFGIMFVIQHLKFYEVRPTPKSLLISAGITIPVWAVFLINSLHTGALGFSVATISMSLSTLFTCMAIIAVINLKQSLRKNEWVVFSIATVINLIADLDYYIKQTNEGFSYNDFSNYGWVAFGIISLYILLRLQKKPDEKI